MTSKMTLETNQRTKALEDAEQTRDNEAIMSYREHKKWLNTFIFISAIVIYGQRAQKETKLSSWIWPKKVFVVKTRSEKHSGDKKNLTEKWNVQRKPQIKNTILLLLLSTCTKD